MHVERFWLECLSQASYLVYDETSREAAVIDPRRDASLYAERCTELGLKLRWILLTHLHADFVAGHLELQHATGAEIALSADAKAEYPSRPLRDGDLLPLGSDALHVLSTPGHTPDSLCYLLHEDGRPAQLFSGDTLFNGDVGRPDLMASVGLTASALAGQLFDSLHAKILPLPDEVVVWPGHGAGSLCGKALGTEPNTTLGRERAQNPALAITSREEFIATIGAGQPLSPAYFAFAAQRNRQQHELLPSVLDQAMQPLSLEAVRAACADRAVQVVDVRPASAFQAGHLEGSINVGLEGRFATWAGSVLNRHQPIVLVAPLGQERDAAMRLGRIGFDQVQGFLSGGTEGLQGEGLAQTERWKPDSLAARCEAVADLGLIDVREPGEFAAGHLDGAISIPVGTLPGRLDELPADRPLLFICRTGYRSTVATSLARRAGITRVADLEGGMLAVRGDPDGEGPRGCAGGAKS